MKKLKNLGKTLSRNEMRIVFAGIGDAPGPLDPVKPYDPLGAGEMRCQMTCDGLRGYRCIYDYNRWICSHP